ncbi:MAG: hypothetical protein O7C74_02720 [Acidobacteria bacterium]|nr:hypothetical protein [Acidobacteriota bacterium]
MSRGGLVMMLVILTLVWGGFALAIGVAMVQERRGRRKGSGQGGGAIPAPGREMPPDQEGD